MSRKRDNLEYNDYGDHGLGLMTKKIKSPLPSVDKLNLNNNHKDTLLINENSIHTNGQNDHTKLSTISNLPLQVFQILLLDLI